MAAKVFLLDNELTATIYKRKNSRNLRLSIAHGNQVRVTIPFWTPYRAGLAFAKSRQDWIESQLTVPEVLTNNRAIGKAHHLVFLATATGTKTTSRVSNTHIIVRYPHGTEITDEVVQKAAHNGCIRALRTQAEQLLPQRLATLAEQHNFKYRSVSIKKLTGRWGSCDQQQNIILNLYLMQLPWPLIDYVLLHELTHTQVMQHGAPFWAAMERVLPGAKNLRKQMASHQPTLG